MIQAVGQHAQGTQVQLRSGHAATSFGSRLCANSAKLLNVATNLAALALFAMKGHVWWHVGLVMAVANVAGSLLGTRLALRHGAGFVRGVFIVVVSALILKTGYDAFLR